MRVLIERKTVIEIANTSTPVWLDDALFMLMKYGQKITAIKTFRGYMNDKGFDSTTTSFGLKEAKDFVEANYSPKLPDWKI